MSDPLLLTFNPGSSTIKIGLFKVTGGKPARVGHGKINVRREPLELEMSNGGEHLRIALKGQITNDLRDVIDETLNLFGTHFSLKGLLLVGHRVVHGGDRFKGPIAIDDENLAAIGNLVPLAPLHQPQSLKLIRAVRHIHPDLLQTASFDTAFHISQPDVVRRFAIPRHFFDDGIKRYGFHGLSYQFVASQLAQLFPKFASGKIVAAHLGSGASLCALEAGASRDTSMGFSTLDGIPMATRCGALDAGVVLHLVKQYGLDIREVEDVLYHRSGLLGVSGLSADSQELLTSALPQAREALDVFTFRIAGEVARLATTLGGIDALVFTAGIGEHQPEVRSAVCDRLAWLGIRLSQRANERNARVVSSAISGPAVLVIPTDEELVIAEEAISVFQRAGKSA
jgi:acetate kinase